MTIPLKARAWACGDSWRRGCTATAADPSTVDSSFADLMNRRSSRVSGDAASCAVFWTPRRSRESTLLRR